ncbi:MAG TPA: flagellar hook-associated protein FlgK [Gemmata sp.]|jgi:flagellar hook-associated protein FlgK|nr:flagellar hook-associated protein FlgK [Gemmata sp.]
MSSLLTALSTGLSAIQSGQTAMQVIGQNLSNASTVGYHDQSANYVATTSGATVGTGVDIASITRYTDAPVETAILQANSQQNATSTQLGIAQQIQTILTAGGTSASGTDSANDSAGTNNSSIGSTLTSFFDQVTQLTSTPDSSAVASTVIAQASTLAGQFNSAATGLGQLRSDLGGQISQTVSQVNSLANQIASLNTQIAGVEGQGGQPNDLLDQRDQLINQLSQQVDVQTVSQPLGVVNVLSSGGPIVVGNSALNYQASEDPSGNMVVTQVGTNLPADFTGGTLGGQIQAFNQDIPTVSSQLDTLANTLSSQVNEIQATGLGTSGPMTSSQGSVSVADPTAVLSSQNLPAPVQAGQLVISVTNTATGTRTNDTIAIDPTTQSLQDVATAITSGTGGQVQASVNATTNTLQLTAQSGYSFDFAGRDTNPPSNSGVSNSDTAGVLAGLGINGLFTGTGAIGISVNPTVAANPGLLASSQSGEPGDSTNLQKMAAIQNQALIGGQTLTAQFTNIATAVGTNVQQMTDQQTSQTGLLQNLNDQNQSVTGVDQNQELVNMLSAQQLIQSASQYMSAVNTTLNSLLAIIQPGT